MFPKITKLSVSLLLFLCFSFMGRAQNRVLSEKEISKLISRAGKHLMELEGAQSLEYAQRALKAAHKAENNLLIARAYNVIALNYDEYSDYQKAIEFYHKGLEYANKTSNDTIKDWLHNNLGNLYTYRKIDVHKGIEHYKKSKVYSQKTDTEIEKAYLNLNIAAAYFGINDYKNGFPYLKSTDNALKITDEIEAKITGNQLYGCYYRYTREYDKAEKAFTTALEYCTKEKPELLEAHAMELYDDFSQYYTDIGDYKNAYFMLEKFNAIKDKLYNAERANTTKIAGAKVEMEEYQRKIDKIESENFEHLENLQKTRIIVGLFVVLLCLLLLYLFSVFKNFKRREATNRQLLAANTELIVAKEKAEEISKLKEQFISTVSHELRTPLYGVVGITDMITDEHPELRESKYIKSLRFSAKYLLSLVNDILQVYKIEEKKIVLEDSVFNLSDELNSIMESVQFLALKNNNKLKLDIDSSIPEFLIGDKIRLSQIFMNLITNSLKFTEGGVVKVVAKQVGFESNYSFIEFKVIDNGIGIKKENQQKVFEKFVQLERRSDDYQGTGLGLPIVKQLIALFGGSIEIESEENIGTTMTFTLALDTDESRCKETLNNLDVDFQEERVYKILVVEDNKINQIVTKKILDIRHFESVVVDDGFKALELLDSEVFDVILMDINMPKINGFETSKRIREKGIKTPIIAVTAFDKQEIIEQVLTSKINEVLVKPFAPNQLYAIIIQLAGKISKEIHQEIKV